MPKTMSGPMPVFSHMTGSCEKVITSPGHQPFARKSNPAPADMAKEAGYEKYQ